MTLVGLLLAEGLALGIAFDGEALDALPHGWWTPILGLASSVMPASAALLAALVLMRWARAAQGLPPHIAAADPPRRYLPYLALHLVSLGGLLALSRILFGAGDTAARHTGLLVACWLLAVTLTIGSWLGAMLPPSVLVAQARARAGWLVAAGALGLIAFVVGRLAQGLWMPLRQATFASTSFVLAALSPGAIADPATLALGAEQFVVEIAPQCSGYEGIGLTWAFVLAALWLFRARFRFPAALWLLVPATLLPFLANVARLVSLVLLGAYVSPELAEGGFHSYAGSLLFCAVALGTVAIGLRARRLTRAPAQAGDNAGADDGVAVRSTAAAHLVPFLAMTAAALISRAFSGGDAEPLYALRPAAGLVALVLFQRTYRKLAWSISPVALAAGLGVAALWLALDHWLPGGRAGAGAAAAAAGAGAAAATPLVVARAASAILLVPLVEELAFRGFLARRICGADFDRIDPARLPWRGIAGAAVAFGLLHHRPLAGIAAGLAYGIIYRRRGAIADAALAHAATNAALVLVAAFTGRWDLWT